jgi:hypothetical protein
VIGHQIYKEAQDVFVNRAEHTNTPYVFAKPAIRLNANGDGDRRDVIVDFQNAPFIFRMPFLGDNASSLFR